MQNTIKFTSREVIAEIRELLNIIDLKLIADERQASPFAKEKAVQDLFSDHRVQVKQKQGWR